MDLPEALIGAEIEQVWVWWSLRLVFDLAGTYVDMTNFRYIDPRGTTHNIRIEDDPEQGGRVLAVLHRRITAASVVEWELRLAFDNGASLVCRPDPKYEAWTLAVAGEATLNCPPLG